MYHWLHHWHHSAVVTPPPPSWLTVSGLLHRAPSWPPSHRLSCSMLGCSDVPGQKIHKEICSSCHIMRYRSMKTFKLQILILIFLNIIWRHLSELMSVVVVDVAAPFLPRAASSPLYFWLRLYETNKKCTYIHYFRDRDTENLHKY